MHIDAVKQSDYDAWGLATHGNIKIYRLCYIPSCVYCANNQYIVLIINIPVVGTSQGSYEHKLIYLIDKHLFQITQDSFDNSSLS